MLTSPNPGLEAAIDYFSLFRCGPALLVRVLWVDSSRDAAALVLGYTYLLSFRASLLGASWGGGLGEKDCAVAAASPLVGAREYTFVRSYSLAPSALCPPHPPGGSAGAVWEGALGVVSCIAAAVFQRQGVEGYI